MKGRALKCDGNRGIVRQIKGLGGLLAAWAFVLVGLVESGGLARHSGLLAVTVRSSAADFELVHDV